MSERINRPGPKRHKPDRSTEIYRINLSTIPRIQYLLKVRQKSEPKTSLSDLVNEAVEQLLDFEAVPEVITAKDRKGVEL